ncbi:hypothetical protein [Flavobacterium palustre]|uniref:hypothetical protein n=1 Tax=Flavobacterium palustre TaxID=1476463 RepID=UPI00166D18BD|nr:hypothetical protein [Flavobacterium palustre]
MNAKAEKAQFDAHKTAADAHQALFDLKQSLTDKGAQGGYAPLDEFTKLAAEYLNIVDDVVTGGSDSLLSAEQGKVLQGRIDGIMELLESDDINLDTVQEIVNAIKEVETSLETILVNDLTTGGTTKALTAEMGKSLKALIDGLESNKVDKVAFDNHVAKSKIYDIGQLQVFKKLALNHVDYLATQQPGDYCIGFVYNNAEELEFISADYLGGDITLKSSYDI